MGTFFWRKKNIKRILATAERKKRIERDEKGVKNA